MLLILISYPHPNNEKFYQITGICSLDKYYIKMDVEYQSIKMPMKPKRVSVCLYSIPSIIEFIGDNVKLLFSRKTFAILARR